MPATAVVGVLGLCACLFLGAGAAGCKSRKANPPAATNSQPDAARRKFPSREEVLNGSPSKFGITAHPGVWGVLLDTGTAEGPATLLALADGTASLALETSEWGVRDNGNRRVRAGAERMCELAAKLKDDGTVVREFGRPPAGRVHVYLLTDKGVRLLEENASALADGRHRLSPLFLLGNDVITRLRVASQTGI
jgi:hypothetical protein